MLMKQTSDHSLFASGVYQNIENNIKVIKRSS